MYLTLQPGVYCITYCITFQSLEMLALLPYLKTTLLTLVTSLYHLQMMLRKGNVFTSMCQEFCPGGCMPDTHPSDRHPPGRNPQADTPQADIPKQTPQASYRNAFLFGNRLP